MSKPKITREELIEKIVAAIKKVSGISIAPEKYGDNLFALGLDSIKAIQVVNMLEDELDLMIDDAHLPKFTSINAIAAHFDSLNK
ncbi:MAG: acyl carrier protein [Candidatus Riflebacteria bacterium HGW-Riflebacteria-2]|jgi:acyl carrier protein|nr:MAG: acyl carrier protein [Candidatus Riflebacteria bacterium HGW-Riflebacteria-2]